MNDEQRKRGAEFVRGGRRLQTEHPEHAESIGEIIADTEREMTCEDDDEPAFDPAVAASAVCPHCGALNTFPGFEAIFAFICRECGEGVNVEPPVT
jgi:hypothetical protein